MEFQFLSIQPPNRVSPTQWENWKWQMKNFASFSSKEHSFTNGTTPYYLKLIEENKTSNLKKTIKPSEKENQMGAQALLDPLEEKKHSPVSRIIHRYPDRVLFLVTDTCGIYCRYCTRKHFTGKQQALIRKKEYLAALDYIRAGRGIREVILSGGDPLTLSDNRLREILHGIRQIKHIEIIRLASRMPVVCPMRITDQLVKIIREFHPVFLLTHFNHPKELTKEAAKALKKAADGGIPLFNQTVLLNGVNNHPSLIQALSRRLLYLRVKPYYMFQCDPSEGTDHLRTTVENSQWIQKELWGRLSGLALPNLSLDIPGGGGKVGLTPNFLKTKTKNQFIYKGWDGVTNSYINPDKKNIYTPPDVDFYEKEWRDLKNQTYGKSPISN